MVVCSVGSVLTSILIGLNHFDPKVRVPRAVSMAWEFSESTAGWWLLILSMSCISVASYLPKWSWEIAIRCIVMYICIISSIDVYRTCVPSEDGFNTAAKLATDLASAPLLFAFIVPLAVITTISRWIRRRRVAEPSASDS